jgi:hypothetical protein
MRIQDYNTVWNVTSPAEIEAALRTRHGAGRNAFWLSPRPKEFPKINILVMGELAYVHYFPARRNPGYASIGTVPGLEPGEETVFFPDDTEEPLEIMNEAVVRFADALKSAQEFAISDAMPRCIQWTEL